MIALDTVEAVLSEALSLKEASLVIFRRGLLVEFKTDGLHPALTASTEHGHRSWQVGPFEGHHCHLDLLAVRSVVFDAEPVSCQGGRLNYTVWFLSEQDCGNPYRPNGLFSVTLNRPYEPDGSPRTALVAGMAAIHERFRALRGVEESNGFRRALERLHA